MKMIFIGGINVGGKPRGGEEAKNQRLISYFKKNGYHIDILDTTEWKSKKVFIMWSILKFLWFSKDDKIIISCASPSAYKLLQIFYWLNIKNKTIYYLVIGGVLHNWIKEGIFNKKYYFKVKKIFVETKTMKKVLLKEGLNNVEYLPNFRPIPDIKIDLNSKTYPINFVFVSRIMKTKGCDLIFESVQILNNKKLKKAFDVSFYGPIEESYESEFFEKIINFSNIKYEGYLNLQEKEGYEQLSKYDVLLFPTFHKGEGFPGILIDSFISGLPVIASDWNFNKEILSAENFIIPPRNAEELSNKMREVIDGSFNLQELRIKAKNRAQEFDEVEVLEFLMNELK